MSQNDMFGDGQPQAGAARFAGASLVHSVETLEQARQMLGRNAGAEILHIELDVPAIGRAPRTMRPPEAAYFNALSTRFEKT